MSAYVLSLIAGDIVFGIVPQQSLSMPYPSHPIAFHPRIDKKEAKLLTDAILSIPSSIVDDLSMEKLTQIDDSEYNIIRKLTKKLDIKEQM